MSMEKHVQLSNRFIEIKRKISDLEKESRAIKDEWEICALAEIGLSAGDIVEYEGHQYIVERRDDTPVSGGCKWVRGYKIKKDGTPAIKSRFIGRVTSQHKIK